MGNPGVAGSPRTFYPDEVSFLRRLFGGSSDAEAAASDGDSGPGEPILETRPEVAAWVRLGDRAFENEREQSRVFELENQLIGALDASGAGVYETNDLRDGYFGMRMNGPDVDRIVEVVRPLLAEAPAGSYLTVRRGPEGTAEERLEIEA
jgi:hypothetical protein